jgi:hypothetical protein
VVRHQRLFGVVSHAEHLDAEIEFADERVAQALDAVAPLLDVRRVSRTC